MSRKSYATEEIPNNHCREYLLQAPQPPRCRKRSQLQIDYFFHILDLVLLNCPTSMVLVEMSIFL